MTDLIRPDDGVRVRGLRRSEFERMVDHGLFEGEPIELVAGELVEVTPQGSAHRWVITRLTAVLATLTAEGYDLAVQLPLAVDDASLPEPDIAVTDPSTPAGHPRTAHVVIEVAVTSQRLDLVHKGPLYAAAGIPLYIVLDLATRRAVIHTGPGPDGYATAHERGPGDVVDVLGITIPLRDLLADSGSA